MNTSLFRWAFALIFMSLIGAFFVPLAAIPRLAVSAHTIGMMSGLLLIAIGAIWTHFRLSDHQLLWLKWLWIYSSYANWIGCLIGGMLGAGRTTPVAAAGMEGGAAAEAAVLVLLGSVGVVAVFAAGLSWWGVRRG
ncbi:hypothetical protein [Pseudohongiella spirulinae]|nr:hypothetical protein [Pseudohongiella spirulinae]